MRKIPLIVLGGCVALSIVRLQGQTAQDGVRLDIQPHRARTILLVEILDAKELPIEQGPGNRPTWQVEVRFRVNRLIAGSTPLESTKLEITAKVSQSTWTGRDDEGLPFWSGSILQPPIPGTQYRFMEHVA